jgi:hypothetical protein
MVTLYHPSSRVTAPEEVPAPPDSKEGFSSSEVEASFRYVVDSREPDVSSPGVTAPFGVL